jgi:hypothetical protein
MNIAALGIDLARGDRVLTTDSEHEGGSAKNSPAASAENSSAI